METKHFYLVRHGETTGNHKHTHQTLSASLTRHGVCQAQAVADILSVINIDAIITSDANRAIETAKYISNTTHVKPIVNELFRELRRSRRIIGKHHLSFVSIVSSVFMFVNAGNNSWHYLDGENVHEFRERSKQAFELVRKLDKQNIVVVSHRGIINAIKYGSKNGFAGSIYIFALYAVLGHLKNGSITSVSCDTVLD